MAGRPEGTAGGYGEGGADDFDRDAWQEFTPWRPGDPSTRGEAPATYAADYDSGVVYRPSQPEQRGERAPVEAAGGAAPAGERSSGWRWTEGKRAIGEGDRVTNHAPVGGGAIFGRVPTGTEGRVTGLRSGMLGGEYATVEFSNGYTEEVPVADLDRQSGWF